MQKYTADSTSRGYRAATFDPTSTGMAALRACASIAADRPLSARRGGEIPLARLRKASIAALAGEPSVAASHPSRSGPLPPVVATSPACIPADTSLFFAPARRV